MTRLRMTIACEGGDVRSPDAIMAPGLLTAIDGWNSFDSLPLPLHAFHVTLALAFPGSSASSLDFEALFARAPNPYVVVDTNLRLVWMNEAYLEVTRRRSEELIGFNMFEAFPSDPQSESHKLLLNSFERVLRSGERDEIAFIRYDIPMPDGTMEERYWSATHTPLFGESGAVEFILQHTVDVTELHGLRRMRDEMGLMQRAHAVQARNLDLTEETSRLRTLFEQAPGFVAILSGPEHRFVVANEAYRTLVGKRDIIGKNIAEALPEVVEQGFVALLDSVRSTGKPYVGNRARVLLDNGRLGTSGDPYYLDFLYQPLVDAEGQVTGVFVQGHDVTSQVEAEERQKLLINELNHRVKNTLSIVQGLAMQSFRRVSGSEVAQQTFDARLSALSSAHSLLVEHDWEVASLADTLRRSAEATTGLDVERFNISGPDVQLTPQTAVSLAMMVHELCTNAIKYGALSEPAGRVAITWTLADEEAERLLTISWVERDGPPVAVPERRGFGTRLIERGLSSELHGEVAMDFASSGLRCTIVARLPVGEA